MFPCIMISFPSSMLQSQSIGTSGVVFPIKYFRWFLKTSPGALCSVRSIGTSGVENSQFSRLVRLLLPLSPPPLIIYSTIFRCLGKMKIYSFHEALPSVRDLYVTLKQLTPDLQVFDFKYIRIYMKGGFCLALGYSQFLTQMNVVGLHMQINFVTMLENWPNILFGGGGCF